VITAVVVLATGEVVTVNVAVVEPAATVTLDGTAELVLDKLTRIPLAGAGLLRVTVPVDELPPTTELGLTLTAESAAGGSGPVLIRGCTQ
jgi:hypothetical protein